MAERPTAQAFAPDYKRILLIRTDRVGDLVLSTPAIASFRRSWPAARIEVLVNDYNEPVVRHNPDLDAVHAVPRRAGWRESRAAARELGAGADLAVALAPRTADIQLCGWSRAARRIGYVYRRRFVARVGARLMLTDVGISDADPALAERHPEMPIAHEVHQVQSLVALAGGRSFSDALVLRYPDADASFAEATVPEETVAINLAPRWFAPDFGFDAVAALIRRIAQGHRNVIVPYGSQMVDAATALRGAVRVSNVAWLGEQPLLRWAAVLGRCKTVIVVDSGTTHVAAAVGVPVVAVYERKWYNLTSREWRPWRVPHAVLCKPPLGSDPRPLIEDIASAARALSGARDARERCSGSTEGR